MRIAITDFKGQVPKRSARLLPDGFAQTAVNARLESGSLGPVREPLATHTLGAPAQTIYRLANGSWLSWDADVSVAPGPIAAERLYITGDGAPKMRVGATEYALALPAPTTAPTLSVVSGTLDLTLAEDILYAYTYVTSLGEESAPSAPSARIAWSPGMVIRLSALAAPPAGRLIDKIRIYRSVTSLGGVTDLYFVDEIAIATTYDHNLATRPAQEALPTAHFSTPVTNLSGLIAMPNGMMAAFAGQTLYFSEPYQPHAWPDSYSLNTDYPIVGLAAFGTYLAVLTEGTPYRVQGTHPDNMNMEKIEEDLPCVSSAGIVDLGYAAVYPSTEGLVLISGSGAQIITKGLFSLKQWAALQPSTIVAARFDGRYFFSCSGVFDGSAAPSAVIDLTGEQPFLMRSTVHALATFRDIRDGRLFYLSTTTQINEWDAGATHALMIWRSRIFVTPQATNMGCMLIEGKATDTPADFLARVYADGVLIHEESTWGTPTRLPAGFMASRWEIEVRTDIDIEAITIAGEFSELMQP